MVMNQRKLTRLREVQQEDVKDMQKIIDAVRNGENPDAACRIAVGYSEFALSAGVVDAIIVAADQKPEKKSKHGNQLVILHKSGVIEPITRQIAAHRNKAGLIPTGAIVFDSILEAKYYRDELLPELGRSIRDIQLQPKFVLTEGFEKFGVKHKPMTYSPDFLVTYLDGRQRCIDTKGHQDERFKVKRKVFDDKFRSLELVVIKHVVKFGGWITVEEYAEKKREEAKQQKGMVRRKPVATRQRFRKTKG